MMCEVIDLLKVNINSKSIVSYIGFRYKVWHDIPPILSQLPPLHSERARYIWGTNLFYAGVTYIYEEKEIDEWRKKTAGFEKTA
jgi:hypothetical protein